MNGRDKYSSYKVTVWKEKEKEKKNERKRDTVSPLLCVIHQTRGKHRNSS